MGSDYVLPVLFHIQYLKQRLSCFVDCFALLIHIVLFYLPLISSNPYFQKKKLGDSHYGVFMAVKYNI